MTSNNLDNFLQVVDELEEDKKQLKKHGLTEEEIEGYIEFYKELFFPHQMKKEMD